MKVKNQTDLAAGLLYVALGGFAAFVAGGYTMGTAANMGTGFFPFWLGILLVGIGIAICASSVLSGAAREQLAFWDWKSLLWVSLSILVFALLFEAAGMVLSVFALVLIASLASHEFSWKSAVLNALFLNAVSYSAFVWLLNIPLRVWPNL